jgi:hypothetical protein
VSVPAGRQEVTVTFTDTHLLPGEFMIDAACHRMNGNTIDIVEDLLAFEALNGPEGEDRYEWSAVRGYIRPRTTWVGHDIPVAGPRHGAD